MTAKNNLVKYALIGIYMIASITGAIAQTTDKAATKEETGRQMYL